MLDPSFVENDDRGGELTVDTFNHCTEFQFSILPYDQHESSSITLTASQARSLKHWLGENLVG